MKRNYRHLRALRYIAPVFCSIAVLSAQLHAGPTVQLNGDESRDGMADSGKVGYVGGNTRIGVSIDRDLQGQVDINQIIQEDENSATSVEGWFGYKIKDDDHATKGFQGGGAKVNHQWVNSKADTVHKVFGAYDRNTDDQSKATLGYGQETEDLFWSGHISKGMGDESTSGDVTTRPYDYGVGGEVGTFIDSTLTRVRGGIDYEFGTEFADSEDRPDKLTVSAGIEQFFHDTPHSISLDVSGNQKSGGNDVKDTDFNARLGYRYEFGGNGAFQSSQTTKRRRVEIPGTPARPGRAAVPAIPPTPAIAATPARPGRAAVPAKYERRAIKTPGHKFVKTTMKLENETFFKLNSSVLTDSAKRNLDKIVSQIRGHGYLGAIRITGNTCGMGDPVYDQRLSENRANAVRDYLMDQGFHPDHLIARGLGKGSPKYSRSDNDFKNRRVDLEYITERSERVQTGKVQYKNVLIQEGRPAIPAQPARPGRAGHPGRPAIPAIAATPGTPARFVWKTEGVKSAPIWIKRALRNTIRHNKTISTYTTRASQKILAADDIFIMKDRDGLIDVLLNDSSDVTLDRVTQPANGTAIIEGDKVRYVPNVGYSGSDSFTYTVIDSTGNETTATVNINIPTVVNNAPVAVSDSVSTNESSIILINVVDNDTDPDTDDNLIIESVTSPTNGTVRIINNQIEYTPNTGYTGSDTFNYTVKDSNGNSSTSVVNVTVTASSINEAPKLTNDTKSTPKNTSLTINAIDNDTDPDGDALTITEVSAPDNGTASIVNNQVVYVPSNNFSGTDNFTYTVTDNEGHEVTASITVTVTEVNTAPTALNDRTSTGVNNPVTIDVLANDNDPDGDTLSITDAGTPSNGTTTISGNSITYTPTTNFVGTDSFVYTITDSNGGEVSATVIVVVSAENQAPKLTNDSVTTIENNSVTIDVTDNDTDPDGDALTVIETTTPENGSVSISGNNIIYTPTIDYTGPDSFTYTVSDGNGYTETATVNITVTNVNTSPTATNDSDTTGTNNSVTIDVLANDNDPDGDMLSITDAGTPDYGTATISGTNIIYTPSTNFVGTDSFVYTITDNNGNTTTATVIVVVSAVNVPPIAANDSRTTNENTPITIDVMSNDSDPDNDTITIIDASAPSSGTTSISGTNIIYTPTTGFVGKDSFVYTITDTNGNEVTATVDITISNVNQAPQTNNDSATTLEDTPVTISVLDNDSDPELDTISITSTSTPINGTVSVSGNNIVYIPSSGFSGTDIFDYTITDGQGNETTASVIVNVTKANVAPIAADDSRTTTQNTATTIDVLDNDSDPDGDTLTITDAGTPSNGTTTISGTNIIYTPSTGYVGSDSFVYTITDSNGHNETATVNILINYVNQAPKLTDDSYTGDVDTPITMDVTTNDVDPEGDTLTVVSITTTSNGTAVISGNNVIYTPTTGYLGADSFTYTVNDGNGNTETSTVNVTIVAANQPPIAVNDTATTNYETTVTIPVSANDTDPEGGLTCVSTVPTLPTNGFVNILSSGTEITYTPFDGFSGTDSFVYTACDSAGATSTATVTVTVGTNPNQPPILSPNYAAIQGYNSVPIRVLEDDSDPEGDTLSIVRTESGPSNGTVTISGNIIYYEATNGFVGADSFYYVVSDGNGNEGSAKVDIDVKNDNNDPTIATIPAFSAAIGITTPIDISSYLSDPDGDSVYIAVADALGGSLTFSGTALQYTPVEAVAGDTDTIYITVSDSNGGTADSIITINVQDFNVL